MKFLNGMWRVAEGFTLHKAAQAYDVRLTDDTLTVIAPTKVIQHRGDTLNLPVLTVELSSPLEGVICVKAVHHKGSAAKRPMFALEDEAPQVTVSEDETHAVLRSGALRAKVDKTGGWGIRFYHGDKLLTSARDGSLAYIEQEGGGHYLREMLDLAVGENVYGMGERFTPYVKNGQVVDIWQEDGGTCTAQAYKNIPFYLSDRGYGVLVGHSGYVSFEVGSEVVSKVQFSVPDEELEYYIIDGPALKDVLSRYTTLSGKPALPPAWSFGLWLSTSFTTNYDETTTSAMIDGMKARDIPLQVFHYDCFWMREFQWCDFEFDGRTFPDPVGMLARNHDKGLKNCVWINPYIAQLSPLFDEGAANGYLVKRTNGDVWQWDLWQAGMGLVDFTNPAACRWYQDKLRALLDMGVDCFKTDFGERIPVKGIVWCDGSDPAMMHNYYTYLYNKVVFELLETYKGEGQAVLFARSATTGSQRFPIHWGGDCTATYESMAEDLRGGLSLALSGFAFWSHDIGGFEATATPDLFKRWVAFGLLSTHSRLHGSSTQRVPWAFGEEASEVLRQFTQLKCRLMPYLFAGAVEAHKTGVPLLRPMLLEYQDDPACRYLDRQYMLGGSLLVAPIFNDQSLASYYLPQGTWINILDEVAYSGGWQEHVCTYFELPVLARPNSIIPYGSHDDNADYNYLDGIDYHLYALADGASVSFTAYDNLGQASQTVTALRSGQVIHVKVDRADYPWAVTAVGGSRVAVPAGTTEVMLNLD